MDRTLHLREAISTTRIPLHGEGPRAWPRAPRYAARFAARTLIDWYRAGLDVERELPKLATYLGHVHVNETYWYLEAVPELLQLATNRVMNNRRRARRYVLWLSRSSAIVLYTIASFGNVERAHTP
jgi:hypothetical protein